MSIWAHGVLGRQVDESWVGECIGTCSAWAVQLLLPKAPFGSFRMLLPEPLWYSSKAESKWCALN